MRIPPVRFGETYRLSFKEGNGPVMRPDMDFCSDLVKQAGSLKNFLHHYLELAARLELAQQAVARLLTESGIKSTLAALTQDGKGGNFLLTNGPKTASADQHLEILKNLNIDRTAPINPNDLMKPLMEVMLEEKAITDQQVIAPNSPELVVEFHVDEKNQVVVDNLNTILNQVK